MTRWRFADSLGHERIEALEAARSFEDIARSLAASPGIQCTHIDRCDEASGFSRLVGCMVIDRPLFDLYFNSPFGYRGAYYASPVYGLEMNAFLLRLMAPVLTEFRHHEEMSSDLMLRSLTAPSAKSWLAEVGKGFCSKCEGDWSSPTDDTPEILNDRWEVATAPNSRFGRKAPFLERVRVMGAFVNPGGEEYVATRKRTRAQDIHDVGWS
jgi:hypothetical protein